MKSKDLGLPIEYQLYPEYFDSPLDTYQTSEKNRVIEQCLRHYGVNSVLDMTCGTGSQVFYLANLGYRVLGSDFSPGLIKIAQEKALAQGLALQFFEGDVRNFQAGEFDAVITIDNAIGHLVKEDFILAVRNIYQNIKMGGIYLFDILNLAAMTDAVIKADSEKMSNKKVTMDGTEIITKRRSTIDRVNGFIIADEDITLCKGKDQTKLHQVSALKIYTQDELKHLLEANGFAVLEQRKVDAYTFQHDEQGYSILTVAQKKPLA